ncbi:MAG: AAA family ATPase, partial [Nanoarchaeota archaeon]|nr:AAA family ATPase [Nanoarchaeota archaeon]
MKKNKKIIAVISPKGGVGKTVTTVNLATSFALEFNQKVLAVDTNITIASLGLHFNILYPHVTISDICRKNFPVSKTLFTYNPRLDVIPASISIGKN